jgi:thymidylate synthase (FAD)
MGSFTAASQHYQKYDEYSNIVHPDMINVSVEHFFSFVDDYYKTLIDMGIPKEEARQVLPNAKAVNIMWTVNARSLINFLNLRLCKRNVTEMLWFALKMSSVAREWWPELFNLVGPDCVMTGKCTQGAMGCDKKKNKQI